MSLAASTVLVFPRSASGTTVDRARPRWGALRVPLSLSSVAGGAERCTGALDAERCDGKLRGRSAIAAHAVEEDREIAAVERWLERSGGVHERRQGQLDHRQIGVLEVGAELPVLARALDERYDQRGDPVSRVRHALLSASGVAEDLHEAPVLHL